MKKSILAGAILFAGFVSPGQTARSLTSFSEVYAQEGIEVFLQEGSSESARVEADGLDSDEVLTEVSGDELKIHLEDNNYNNIRVKVYVTYKQLSALGASSSASITVADNVTSKGDFDIDASSSGSVKVSVSADEVDIDVSSSGDVDVNLTATSLDAELSSSGRIRASGSSKSVSIGASSSGNFDGIDFVTDVADLRGSSGASIKLTVNERLDGRASSGASIRYKGNPSNTNADSSSGGSVRKY